MTFLWNLLPGAREARNDLVVGYMWIVAVALWIGIPKITHGRAHDLLKAVHPVGLAIAVSVVAFLVGSFSADLIRLLPGLREAKAFSVGWEDPASVLAQMTDREVGELERLEGAIDRNTAEVTFRISLIPPTVVAGAALAAHAAEWWWWMIGGIAVVMALYLQSVLRRRLSYSDIRASVSIRSRAASRAGSQEEQTESRAWMRGSPADR